MTHTAAISPQDVREGIDMKKNCKQCHKSFKANRKCQIYCSRRCGDENYKLKLRGDVVNGTSTMPYQKIRFAVLSRDNFTCVYCGRSAPNVELVVDHIVPKSKGGPCSPGNLVAACTDCNLGKSDVVLEERQIAKLKRLAEGR